MMFDKANVAQHIGDEIKYRDRLKALQPLEEYFISKCGEAKIDWSHDCTADENTYFNTLNYTNFAGMFIMHPLCYSLTMFQMYDAKADNLPSAGHLEWIKGNIDSKVQGKYTLGDGSEMDKPSYRDVEALIVLPGSNKFHQHVQQTKLGVLCEKYKKKCVLKMKNILLPV